MKPEDYKADRSRWKQGGAWWQEPDRLDWEHEGVTCLALRHPTSGHWCGYVGMKPGHPWYGKDYDSVECEVHYGLTYAQGCEGNICHTPKPGEPEHLWWLGFDCAHCDDVQPCDGSLNFREATYKTLEFVRLETERLARQSNEVKPA
jgi:hypothetical protein